MHHISSDCVPVASRPMWWQPPAKETSSNLSVDNTSIVCRHSRGLVPDCHVQLNFHVTEGPPECKEPGVITDDDMGDKEMDDDGLGTLMRSVVNIAGSPHTC